VSNWLVAIVGGVIATVVGGVVLFCILPSQQMPASVAPPAGTAGLRHLKCTMKGGTMVGRVFSFSIDADRKEVTWTDYGIALKVGCIDDKKILTGAEYRLRGSGWPKHEHIFFDFNRLTLSVQASLGQVPDNYCAPETQTSTSCIPPGFVVHVGESDGECVETVRTL
jgi:hypothetical protein